MTRRRAQKRATGKVIYNGRVFRVERDQIVLPNGMAATMDIVRHRGSVVLIPQPGDTR